LIHEALAIIIPALLSVLLADAGTPGVTVHLLDHTGRK
jgi:hypothetical protein